MVIRIMEILLYVMSDSGNWGSPRAGGDVPGRTATSPPTRGLDRARGEPRRTAADRLAWPLVGGGGGPETDVHYSLSTCSPPLTHAFTPGEFYRERHPFIRQRTSHSFFHPLPGCDGVDRRQDLIWAATGGRSRECDIWPAVSRQMLWLNSSSFKTIMAKNNQCPCEEHLLLSRLYHISTREKELLYSEHCSEEPFFVMSSDP